jgi:hypothetical protein
MLRPVSNIRNTTLLASELTSASVDARQLAEVAFQRRGDAGGHRAGIRTGLVGVTKITGIGRFGSEATPSRA